MKSLILKMLLFGLMFIPMQYLYSQDIDLTLKYIPETNVYEVYARPDFSQNNFFLAGGSQITVVFPSSITDATLSVTSVSGGPWSDNSQVYAPAAAATKDFHGVATNGSQVNLVANVELLLFRFSLAVGCAPGVRIFENLTDPGPSDPGMNGAGFGNYVGNVFTLQDHYGENYNNTGTVCGPIDNDGDGVNQGPDPDDNNPCVPNPLFATCDQDNDGLTNQEEAAIGTNPTNPDTDGDGINDGTEVDNGTNPLNPCDPNPANPACVVDPEVEFTIKFNPVTCTYEVYAMPNFTQNNFFIAGGSQLSIAIPALAGNQPLVITTLAGGVWTDNSQVYGPGASPAHDFHAVSSDGSLINFVANTEILLFTFQLPGGVCCLEGVRLFENDIDPDSSDTGMSDGDFDNYFADIFVMDNYYEGNYNNNGLMCNECLINPVATPTASDLLQDFCVSDTPTLADIVVNETNIRWYPTATGGILLLNTTPLVNGTTYYAAQFDPLNNCESAIRLAIAVTVDDAPTPTTPDATQDFCSSMSPTVASILVNEAGVVWYTTATAGTIVPATTALVTGTTYYGSLTDAITGCQSSVRLAVTVTVGSAPTPTTTDSTQDFCLVESPTVADIQVNETGVIWYNAAAGGTVVPNATALVSGTTYFASLTDGFTGCESAPRLAVTVTIGSANTPTTTDTTQQFCAVNNPTIGDIQVNEAGVAWYTAATGGIALAPTVALTTGTTYYGSLMINGCESTTRLAVSVTIEQGITPTTTDTTQQLCAVNNPTVADIQVNQNVVFYLTATGGTALPATTAIVNGTTYYASYTDPGTGCASAVRLAITVTLSNGTTPTTNSSTQSFCETDNATVGSIQVNEPSVVFYLSPTGGAPLANTTLLVDNTTYYASIVDGSGCASAVRLAVTVNVDDAGTPTTNDTSQNFCTINAPTIANIQVNEPFVVWYATAVGGVPMPETTPLVSGVTYYGALGSASGCASATRLAVLVTVNNGQTPTTQDAIQDFCAADSPTVADLQVNQTNVTFYTSATGGIIFPSTEPLVDSMIYYASFTDPVTGCPSTVRLPIQANVSSGTTPTTLDSAQEFCESDLATVADLQVNENGVSWYTSAMGGVPLSPTTLLTDGMTYYASITVGSCPSGVRLAIVVTVYDNTVATITGGGAITCFGTEVTYTTESGNSAYIWDIAGGTIAAGGTPSDNFITVAWSTIGEGFVSVSYTDVNGCAGSASAILDVDVTSCSDLRISKTVDNTTPRINDNVNFSIEVNNEGTSTFTNIIVSELLPSGYEYVNSVISFAAGSTFDPVTGIWTIPLLGPGQKATMLLTAKVVFGGNYTNVATLMESTPIDSDPSNNSAEATVEPTCLTVYNEFSPNGDGVNDVLIIDCIEYYPLNTLQVFNRYGSPVYETERYQNNWDGTANVDGVVRKNEKLPVGTYYYILEVDGKAKTGWVYIMR